MSYEKRVILKHSAASIVALALFGISRFIYSLFISRKFGIEALGSANSLISQAFLIAIPLSFFAVGLGKYSAEFLGRGQIERIKSISTIGFASILIGVVLLPLNFYLALISIFRAFQLTFRSFLYGIHRGEVYAYITLAAFCVFLLSFLISNIYLPYIALLGAVTLLGVLYNLKNSLFSKPTSEDFKLLLAYSSMAFLGTLAGVFLIQGPYFMSEKLGSATIAGKVSASLSAAFLLTYLPQVLQSAIMPLYSYKYGKNEMDYVKKLAEGTTEILSYIIALITFGGLIIGREILSYMFGFSLGREFYLALIAIEVYIAYNPSIVALSSTRYIKDSTLISIFGAIATLIAWFFLIPAMKETGAMLGLLIGYALIFSGVAYFSKKRLEISLKSYKPLLFALPLQVSFLISKIAVMFALIVYLYLMKEEARKGLHLLGKIKGGQ
ncbi:lipopolysaccharide biosynthesis protein [Thermococci archaeon]|nr:MAG: lipopolysaccharide biosynthesis protein [Thermococci archaeon]